MKKFFFVYFFFFVSAYSQVADSPYVFDLGLSHAMHLDTWKYHAGDHAEWALTDYPDAAWQRILPNRFEKKDKGIHWYRNHIMLTGKGLRPDVLTLLISDLPIACEVYWDGYLVGRNGRVGETVEQERPGSIIHFFNIQPAWCSPGTHVISVRFSNQLGESRFRRLRTLFGYSTRVNKQFYDYMNKQLFIMGIYLTAVILSFALFFSGGRNRVFLLFAVNSLFNLLEFAIPPLVSYFNITTLYLDSINWVILIGTHLNWILLNIFLILYFRIPGMRVHVVAIGLFLLPPLILENAVRWFEPFRFFVLSFYTLGLLFYAVHKRRSGSIVASVGYAALMTPMIFAMLRIPKLDWLEPVTSIFFMFCIIVVIALRIRAHDQQRHAAILQSKHLELELLKKTIQPHFIMNTLISIISLIGENPPKAIRMIRILADEFRAINRMMYQKLIPIDEELQLCRAHLELMEFRMDAAYTLTVRGVNTEDRIPPMIFHTLIENGLTHAFDINENGHFEFQCTGEDAYTRYRLWNDGSRIVSDPENFIPSAEEGMGLSYVKARLQESYPERWLLHYGIDDGRWLVDIKVRK